MAEKSKIFNRFHFALSGFSSGFVIYWNSSEQKWFFLIVCSAALGSAYRLVNSLSCLLGVSPKPTEVCSYGQGAVSINTVGGRGIKSELLPCCVLAVKLLENFSASHSLGISLGSYENIHLNHVICVKLYKFFFGCLLAQCLGYFISFLFWVWSRCHHFTHIMPPPHLGIDSWTTK